MKSDALLGDGKIEIRAGCRGFWNSGFFVKSKFTALGDGRSDSLLCDIACLTPR
jgi:hypothetical protein